MVHKELLDNIHDYDGDEVKKYWTIAEYDAVLDTLERDVIEDEEDEDALLTEENVFLDVETDDAPEENMENNFENEEEEDDDDDDADDAAAGLANRAYGLRKRCPLNQLQAFHAVISFPPDCMHDWLEGVIAQDLNGGIKILVQKGWFSLNDYNYELNRLGYPSYESYDRPQEVPKKSKKLSGKAVSLWVHIRNFPMIMKSLVRDQDDEVFQYLLLLVDITAKITAMEFRGYEIYVLEEKVIEFLDARKIIFSSFPDLLGTPKPKHHLITHYGQAIRLYGPPLCFWIARFESKHR